MPEGGNVTTDELIKMVAERHGVTQVQTKEILYAMLKETSAALAEGDTVVFERFGAFMPKNYNERLGYNAIEETYMRYPQKRGIAFTPSDAVREEIKDVPAED